MNFISSFHHNGFQERRRNTHIVFNDENGGSTIKQWKKGIKLSKGEWVWIAESDDYADIHFLEKLIPVVGNNELVAMAYSQTFDVDEKGSIIESRIKWTNNFTDNIWRKDFCIKGKDFLKFLYEKNVVPNASACLVKKNYLQTALNKDIGIENFKMCSDWFLWLLIADLPGVYISFINNHLNYFRDIQQSTRNHNSKEKLANRLLEEAKIFNSRKFEIERNILQQKNESIKNKWLRLYSDQKFSFSFFRLHRLIHISRYSLLKDYLRSKKYIG